MKPFNVTIVSFCAIATFALSGCSTAKEQFDFSKKAPDEFAVVKRAPLEMPTSMKLPPPRPGAPRPQEAAATQQAKKILFGTPESTSSQALSTSGESLLLQKAGATSSNATIRDTVDQENLQSSEENVSTFDKILGRTGTRSYGSDAVINPAEELKRLEQQQSQ